MRGACLVLFLATARGSPIDYDHEPPDPRVSRVAAVVRAANHRALERLRRVLAPRAGGGGGGALGALCAPPFPPHALNKKGRPVALSSADSSANS